MTISFLINNNFLSSVFDNGRSKKQTLKSPELRAVLLGISSSSPFGQKLTGAKRGARDT